MKKKRLKFFAAPEDTGLRLDKFLSNQEGLGTRSQIQGYMDEGLVHYRGQPAKASHKVLPGESFEVFLPEPKEPSLDPYEFPLDIIYEDNDLLVVNKPAGLVVHPAHGHASDTLVNALVYHNKTLSHGYMKERPGLIHRIDRDTSGLLVVAKTERAQNSLAKQFERKTVARRYYALCFGEFKKSSGTIKSHLVRHSVDRKRFASLLDGAEVGRAKHAVTHFVVQANNRDFSFVELKLETGRTHQIRVHLSELGHPIVGDEVYGGVKRARSLKSVVLRKHIENMQRFALHAFELGFYHPTKEEDLVFLAPWPADLQQLLALTKLDLPEGVRL